MKDKCLCGSVNIKRIESTHIDTWTGGEEIQHLDICKDCGKARLIYDFTTWSDDGYVAVGRDYGKWE